LSPIVEEVSSAPRSFYEIGARNTLRQCIETP